MEFLDELYVDRRKWPDSPHYRHRAFWLGEDEHGMWVGLREGQPVWRGSEVLFVSRYDGLMLLPRHQPWMAWFPGESDLEVYVDIVTPTALEEREFVMVDLDLDVARYRDGRVALLDEDEFDAHRIALGYPDEVVRMARESAAAVMEQVATRQEPYDRTFGEWFARFRSGSAS